MTMPLSTSSTAKQFEECGYAVLKELLDPQDDLNALHVEYSALLDTLASRWHAEGILPSAYQELELGDRFTMVLGKMHPSCLQYFDITLPKNQITEETPVHLGPAVFHLIRNPRLLDAVESIIGAEVYSNPMQRVRIRPPQHLLSKEHSKALAAATPWHQDLGAVLPEADNSDMLTVWVPMTEATPKNGCLLLIPGSHKGGLLPHSTSVPGTKQQAALHIPDEFVDGRKAVAVPLSPGDVLFLHRNTLHASLPNLSAGTRWSFDLRYNPMGQPTGRPVFPGFIARSRRRPEQELSDPGAWAQLWIDCRKRLAGTRSLRFYRWDAMVAIS
jgi:phytanoyl-CoA hydroxylase